MITIKLKRGKEESLLRRHPWLFSGAIHSSIGGEPEEGDVVDVVSSEGQFMGRGHCGIGSIAVRILTFAQDEQIDQQWWNSRLADALNVRRALGVVDNPGTTCYRLVHGEGDSLPGLIVDIYGSTAVIQAHTVGMYLIRQEITEALRHVYGDSLTAVYDKSSGTVPFNSGIEAVDGYLWGTSGEDFVKENSLKFYANWEDGQKTGFFIDQRENRELVKRYSHGRTVLNTFCYTGGFSAYALSGGAVEVDSVDSSAKAIAWTEKNIELNFPQCPNHHAYARDTMDFIKDMPEGRYDLVILDPPAYAKHQRALSNALQGYKRLNARAMEKMKSGSILFTFSCSQAVSREQFRMAVFSAAILAGKKVRILHQLTQPADHPVNICHPEGEYLKGLVLYVE